LDKVTKMQGVCSLQIFFQNTQLFKTHSMIYILAFNWPMNGFMVYFMKCLLFLSIHVNKKTNIIKKIVRSG